MPQTVAALGTGDAARGERIFWAGGCTSCHSRPKSEGDARLELAGGLELKTPFGTFVPPNISSDPQSGIGSWSLDDFANAMMRGVAPDGSHLYPSFPYTSYARMKPADIADLYAFMKTLPAVAGKAPDHKLSFPFNIRRGLGLWKLLYLSDEPVIALASDAPEPVALGRYLVEGPGHCGECHTPRGFRRRHGQGALAVGRRCGGRRGRSCPTSHRARAASAIGPRAKSPAIWKPALRRSSIRSAARWSRSSATWRGCSPPTARRSPPT